MQKIESIWRVLPRGARRPLLKAQRQLGQWRLVSELPEQLEHRRFTLGLIALYCVAALLLALAITATVGYHGLFLPLNYLGGTLSEEFWACVTVLGDTRIALAVLLFFVYRHPRLLPAALLASLPTTLVIQAFKRLSPVPRPSGSLEAESFYQIGQVLKMGSFPSGHSATAGVLFGLLLMIARTRQNKLLLLAMMVVVALSRVMVGAHWPVDIVVGSAVGLVSATAGYLLAEHYRLCRSVWSQLAVLGLLVVAAVGIFFTDSGYPQAHLMTMILAVLAMTTYSLHVMGVEPDRRWALGRP